MHSIKDKALIRLGLAAIAAEQQVGK